MGFDVLIFGILVGLVGLFVFCLFCVDLVVLSV